MTTALLLKGKVIEWPGICPDLNPFEHMWGILKQKVQKHHVSNIQQLRDVIREEWKRTPATTCAALVNSMPRRIKAVLDNNGAPTKYWHFGHSLTCSLRVYSFLLPVIWTIMVICWVIFRGQYICTYYYSKIYPSGLSLHLLDIFCVHFPPLLLSNKTFIIIVLHL